MSRQVKDGRSARWDAHRAERRAELVLAAVAAIDTIGPAAGISEIARAAGVSKPVLYRYFDNQDDLYGAVGRWGADEVMSRLLPAILTEEPVRDRVAAGVEAYLATIEEHPHEHGQDCGHVAVPHGDHVDYVHDGHRHAAHGRHYDEH